MAKRFTATEKWEDLWFSELDINYKLFWIYLLDKCDNCGIWEKNFKVASFFLGKDVNETESLVIFKERIIQVNGNKWFIPKFIQFQYGELNEMCNPHKPVITKLTSLGLYKNGEIKGINTHKRVQGTLKDKDKDKDKEQDKDKDICLFKNSIFLDKDKFKQAFYSSPDYTKYDWEHYYEAVKNWSGSKNKKMANWILTAYSWARKDGDKYPRKGVPLQGR